jgi:hypothetical protein
MRYGYFDDINREYVITRPDTPLPWINYLGCEEHFGLISNTAAIATITFPLIPGDATSTCVITPAASFGRPPGSQPSASWKITPAGTARIIPLSLPPMPGLKPKPATLYPWAKLWKSGI